MKQFYFEESIEEVQNAFLFACQLLTYTNINLDSNSHQLTFRTKNEGFKFLHEVTIVFRSQGIGTAGVANFTTPPNALGTRYKANEKKSQKEFDLIINSVTKLLGDNTNSKNTESQPTESFQKDTDKKETDKKETEVKNKPKLEKTTSTSDSKIFEEISKLGKDANINNKKKDYRNVIIVAIVAIVFFIFIFPMITAPKYNADNWKEVENELMWKSKSQVRSILGKPDMTNINEWTYFRKVKNDVSGTKCSLYITFSPDGSGVFQINYGNCK